MSGVCGAERPLPVGYGTCRSSGGVHRCVLAKKEHPEHQCSCGREWSAAPPVWHCNKCGYTGSSGPVHDVFPDGGRCNYAAANMSERASRSADTIGSTDVK